MTNTSFPNGIDCKLTLSGPVGTLEALSTYPKAEQNKSAVAIICHPHPLHEGTMHNKVVHTLSRAYHNQGIATVRFNYRGVGASVGEYGDYVGEIEDCLAIYQWVQQVLPNYAVLLGGFSFGGYIATAVAGQIPCKHLITVAPAVNNKDFNELVPKISCPWTIIQGTEDEIVPPEQVYDFARSKHIPLQKLEQAGHFFHSKLIDLRQLAENSLSTFKL